MSLIEPEQKMTTAKQIHGDMPMLDRYIQEIKTVTKKVSYEKYVMLLLLKHFRI